MPIDPTKFATSPSNTLIDIIKGTYHSTNYWNLQSIMEDGILAGKDVVDESASGRLRSHWGVFAPWDPCNQTTKCRSSANRNTPLVVLYVPIADLVRQGGKITEIGIIVANRPIPFKFVKEVWLCIPGVNSRRRCEEVEKTLDYELEDEVCVLYGRSPPAYIYESYRRKADGFTL